MEAKLPKCNLVIVLKHNSSLTSVQPRPLAHQVVFLFDRKHGSYGNDLKSEGSLPVRSQNLSLFIIG